METKIYSVNKVKNSTSLFQGESIDSKWIQAEILSDFCSPWNDKIINIIEFRAVYDLENIYFYFKVDDSTVFIDTTDNTNASINNSDRIELFFRQNESLNPYYCLEIDPTPRIMDFKALPNKKFDFNWNWPSEHIKFKSSVESTFFKVEIEISLASLKKFGLLNEGKIETGIFRAKYNLQDNGSYKATWITWVDPKTELPNFHTPASFGVLKLNVF